MLLLFYLLYNLFYNNNVNQWEKPLLKLIYVCMEISLSYKKEKLKIILNKSSDALSKYYKFW